MGDPVILKLNRDTEEYEAAETEFLEAVGLFITQWAFVDRQLFRLFNFGLEAKRSRSAAIYYRQNSLDQRLKLTTNILRHAFTDREFKERWKPLLAEFEKLIPTRNIIVHHPAKRTGTSENGKAIYVYAIHIEPYELALNKKYPGLRGKNEIRISDLNSHAANVKKLEQSLVLLVAKLLARP
jgi:hypothetical protein